MAIIINFPCIYNFLDLAATLGDPHIFTLDGIIYTFNGLGEYTLLTSDIMDIQGRTAQVQGTTGATMATYLSSITVKQHQPQSDIVEFRLDGALSGIG